MNLQQRIALWLGTLVFAFVTLRPPWVAVHAWAMGESSVTHYEQTLGFHFLWNDLQLGRSTVRVDFQRLVLEWLVVGGLTAALLWTLSGHPDWQIRRVLASVLRRRTMHVGFLLAGLLLMTAPVARRWGKWRWQSMQYAGRVSEFRRKIPELARLYAVTREANWSLYADRPSAGPSTATSVDFGGAVIEQHGQSRTQYQVVDEESAYDVPGVGRAYFSDRMSGREIADALRSKSPQIPNWYLDAVAADVNLTAVPNGEQPGDPPRPFRLWGALLDNLILESLGLTLLVLVAGSRAKTAHARLGVSR